MTESLDSIIKVSRNPIWGEQAQNRIKEIKLLNSLYEQ